MTSGHATTPRQVRQIVGADGKPCQAAVAENIWVGYKERFADKTDGNAVTPLTSGKQYFEMLIKAMKAATKSIYIAGWQVNWDAMLAPGVRLFDVLYEVAQKKSVQIYVMPWDDADIALQTYDNETRHALLHINELVGTNIVHVELSPAYPDESKSFFSHHQKQVVIDNEIAFVGGIDIAYGRYDDEHYDLRADAKGRKALNRYNNGIPWLEKLDWNDVVDPAYLSGWIDRMKPGALLPSDHDRTSQMILQGAHEVPMDAYKVSGTPNPTTLDPRCQPRMPWQDVHVKIVGPAVADLAANFVLRWNIVAGGKHRLDLPQPASAYPKSGSCMVQVLRSAPENLRKKEHGELKGNDKKRFNGPTSNQHDVLEAMSVLIDKAKHFIYIENQFFQSNFGQEQDARSGELSGPAQEASKKAWALDQTTGATLTRAVAGDSRQDIHNPICGLLAERFKRVILDIKSPPFHIYITLPVHPEGALKDGPIMTQIHLTMQTLSFGSQSLLNRIRRLIKARQLRDQKVSDWQQAYLDDEDTRYEDIPIAACDEYVTLLNLRNWAKFSSKQYGERYVTEQIYVHSKLMIVDDRFALLGSANINDRSLLGGRDSELAVLITDTATERVDICGNGKPQPVRGFARNLRIDVWNKIFGITAGGERAANELKLAVKQPGNPKSWKAIQKRSKQNAVLYEKAFKFIPRNKSAVDGEDTGSSSIWPTWSRKEGKKVSPMPFDEAFWQMDRADIHHVASLVKVKGFITALPTEWTNGEKNNFGYHAALVAENSVPELTPANENSHSVVAIKDEQLSKAGDVA